MNTMSSIPVPVDGLAASTNVRDSVIVVISSSPSVRQGTASLVALALSRGLLCVGAVVLPVAEGVVLVPDRPGRGDRWGHRVPVLEQVAELLQEVVDVGDLKRLEHEAQRDQRGHLAGAV